MTDVVDELELLVISQYQVAGCAVRIRKHLDLLIEKCSADHMADLKLLSSVMTSLYLVWADTSYQDVLTAITRMLERVDPVAWQKVCERSSMPLGDRVRDLQTRLVQEDQELPPPVGDNLN